MKTYDIVVLTDSRYVEPKSPGQYELNVLQEDQLVQDALQAKGLSVTRKAWSDPEFDWTTTKSVLFRTTWDYFDRFQEFSQWMTETSSKTAFINTPSLINWNIDKHYLGFLYEKQVRTVPTRFIPRGTEIPLKSWISMTGWSSTVIKPTVGGAARHTYVLNRDNLEELIPVLEPLIKEEDFMIQPFQHSITSSGEWSFVVFGNQYSHAVLKKAKEGDFRVQDDYGGTVHEHTASQHEIDFVLRVIQSCPELPAYARVDVILDNDGYLAVSELELIEPELWFRMHPEASILLADEVLKRIQALP